MKQSSFETRTVTRVEIARKYSLEHDAILSSANSTTLYPSEAANGW